MKKGEKMKKLQQYALYKGEKLLGMGTARELAKQLGIKVDSIYFLQTPTYRKRREKGKNNRVLIRIEDDEEWQ